MGEEIMYRLRKNQNSVYRYPVAECPSCHELAPCGLVEVTDGETSVSHRYCMYCQYVSDYFEIQGYISAQDMEDTGWTKTRGRNVAHTH